MNSGQELSQKFIKNKHNIPINQTSYLSNNHRLQVQDRLAGTKIEKSKILSQVVRDTSIQNNQIQRKTPRKRIRRIQRGHWSVQQNAKYYLFMKSHLSDFRSKHSRSLEKVFNQMSSYIGSRTSNQCRSHHQKQQEKHVDLGNLMSNLYELTMQHPLLRNQVLFSWSKIKYGQLFCDLNGQDNKDQRQVDSNENNPLIVFQMPEPLKVISHEQYINLLSKH